MAFAHVLNEERFNPSRLPGLSLWLDAQDTNTVPSLPALSTVDVNTTWASFTGAQCGVSLSTDETILYSLTYNSGIITKIILSSGTIISPWVTTGLSGARTMITGKDGNLYITDFTLNMLTQVITSTGVVNKNWATGLSTPFFFTQGADRNFYVVNVGNGTIRQISPTGVTLNAAWANVPPINSRAIVQGKDGNFYITLTSGTIIQVSSSGVVLNSSWISGLVELRGISVGSDGFFYVAGYGVGTIIKISPEGVVVNTSFVTGLPSPYQIAFTSAGTFYVSSFNTPSVARIIGGNTMYWRDKSSNANNFYTSSGNPTLSNTFTNQPSMFLPSGARMTSSISSGLTSSKSIFMVYQCPQASSVMRFSVGNDVSGQAFGFAQSNSTVYSPYQYGYGDTRWTVDTNTYILPNFVSGICDASATMIRGDYNFNPDRDIRETALQNLVADTPFTLGTSLTSSSIFVSANFHVCEIIAYNRALFTTERQMIEGYVGWKWGMASRLPIGHPYEKFPPSGEQVVSPSTPLNVFSGLVSWLDMSDPSTYTLSGTNLKTIRDKVDGALFTIGGNQDALPLSTIGGLPSLNFPGNVTGTLTSTTNPFLSKTIAVPSQGCAIAVMIPRVQYTAATLGMFGWGKPGNSSNNPGLGYNAPTATVSTLQSYNTGTSVFFGPSLSTVPGSPTIIFWAWYGGNMFYLSSNGNTILSSTQTDGFYSTVSTDNTFYIGNDGGYGAQFNLGELCMYNEFLETPFRNILEGYLAWKWGMPASLPSYHPYYLAAPSLQTLTEVNAVSQPPNIAGLTMWVDAADTTTIIDTVFTPSVVLTGSYTFLSAADGYDYYMFTGNGTVKTNIPISVKYLAVGGGGGGGAASTSFATAGGGGGSGGLKTNTTTLAAVGQSLLIPSLVANSTYTIVIGSGGDGGIFSSTPATNGNSTTFSGTGINVIANGGAFGINSRTIVSGGAADIGSGAGGGFGGSTGTSQRNAGGGGGILSAGAAGNSTTPGAGGIGLVFLTVPLGAGGGAGGYNKSGFAGSAGGTVIGGAGGIGPAGGGAPARSGTANTGSGGGGGGQYGNGASGGSGVFILGIPSILPTRLFTWLDKSVVSNNLVSSEYPPTVSSFGTPLRPSVYLGPGRSLMSTYTSGANTGQFSAFLVASVPTLSYLLVTTGQLAQASVGVPGQTFGFYASNGTTSVFSPYVVAGTGATNNAVGTYSTINGRTFEAFASVNGTTLSGNMNFTVPLCNVVNTATAIPATPWIFGDCLGDNLPKSFHVHEFITYSRALPEAERQSIEGYLYWKWLV